MIAASSPVKIVFPCRFSHNHRSAQLSAPRSNLGHSSKPEIGANSSLPVNHLHRMNFLRRIAGDYFLFRETPSKDVKIESDAGGEDLFDAAAVDKAVPEHLVIMVNGLNGRSTDWKYAAEQFVKRLPGKVIVHRSECNHLKLTFDGIDLMGERLADEVLSVVRNRPGLQKISFVAHSMGGLVARYAIGRLYQDDPEKDPLSLNGNCPCDGQHKDTVEARIAGLEPINFITVATPHLGSRGHKQFPFLCGIPFLERSASQTAHFFAGKSGKHLFLTDNDEGRPPLLLQMVKDSDDLKFMSALRAFRRRVAYANANYDHMVGWRTSSIRRPQELPKSKLFMADKRYPHVVYIERQITDSIQDKVPSVAKYKTSDMEEEMIEGLTQVPWERVDVSFQKSRQRYMAHNTIQVQHSWFNSDGADVVFHMIDNFLL